MSTITIKNVAIYCRVSTDDQSTDRQVADLIEYAQRCGYNIVGEPFTEKLSGMKTDRPERKKVMALARQRKIDAVLVTEMSRWGRSTEDLLSTLKDLANWKVSLITLSGGLSLDLSSATGQFMVTILAGVSEFERNLIAERVRSGLASAKARGRVGGRKVGENPSDKYAKKVLAHIGEGRTVRWIAKELQISKTTVMNIKRRNSVVT